MAVGWSMTVGIIIVRTRVLPRWLGLIGLAVSLLYLLNQGDILATTIPGFPVWDLAGLLGSTTWGLWVAALGVTLLLRRSRRGSAPVRGQIDNVGGNHAVTRPTAGTGAR
jgi:uncharacterized protein DUF4386